MIISAEFISIPYSGEFPERIYENKGDWNSQNWSFIQFEEDDHSKWVGHFRGFPKKVAISEKHSIVLVLTSDYLFQLDVKTGNVVELIEQSGYQNLTVSPHGDFILSDYYNLERITTSIIKTEHIDCQVKLDIIEFKEWDGTRLEFTCEEFLNWDNQLTMLYDCKTNLVLAKNAT